MEIFLTTEAWIALATLIFLEIVLGIDNIIFISLVVSRLPERMQTKARFTGISGALIIRILLLLTITWIIGFKEPLFRIFSFDVSGRDLILALGGLFLLAKSTSEIHHKFAEGATGDKNPRFRVSLMGAIFQIMLLDIIFSFDSILTAVGLTDQVLIMIIAVIIAMFVMALFSGVVSAFINKYPTLQILALSFLIMIGFMLIVDALHYHVPKGYIYFAVFFSLTVEMINIRLAKKPGRRKKARK